MPKYVIISPVRDEESWIELTLESVLAQTILPLEWIIVDDGSGDGTLDILHRYAAKFSWIRTVERRDRGYRKPGTGVIEAFYEGYSAISRHDWEFLVKLDGDLSFHPNYFERCFDAFSGMKDLGICGGAIHNIKNGVPVLERVPLFHVRGATKIYKRACWEQIEPLLRAPGWDTIDEIKANMLGWKTRSLTELKIIHHRSTGAAEGSWRDSMKHGRANYISGYHPVFMLLKCIKRLFQTPFLIGSVGMLVGYTDGYLKGIPQVSDPRLINYIRKQQLRSFFGLSSLWNGR